MKDKLAAVCTNGKVLVNEPMKNHITFKTGGPADYFIMPATISELKRILAVAREEDLPVTVIGNGSNLLVLDKGIRGLVICTLELKEITVDGQEITASCGVSLAALAGKAREHGLTGLEFASGIPGTVGGGIVMNAGAYGGSLSECAVETLCMDESGNLKTFRGDEQQFGYRKSAFSKGDLFVLQTKFDLHKGISQEISELMAELNARRREKQPLEKPSAGSTFKRPEGYFAGKLIEDAGLKGYRVGGASVSEKHAGFIVNDMDGSASDVLAVIEHCKNVVYEKFGVMLEPEVRILGE
ncbi:MAG: UDP-N-acetylmuramate dehydrogenase [Clostridia bacterium]|nr:UDP-N-acetylmuramate dehydrogenase [Clostridia bacterium]